MQTFQKTCRFLKKVFKKEAVVADICKSSQKKTVFWLEKCLYQKYFSWRLKQLEKKLDLKIYCQIYDIIFIYKKELRLSDQKLNNKSKENPTKINKKTRKIINFE